MGIPAPAGQGATGIPPAGDQANAVIQGSFIATGTSLPFAIYGAFNVSIWGLTPTTAWSGVVSIERSFDGGTTWLIVGVGGAGQGAIYTGSTLAGQAVSIVAAEPEKGVLYRVNCSTFTSGTINYRISTTGLAAISWGVPIG